MTKPKPKENKANKASSVQIKTILNRVHPLKSFVYQNVTFKDGVIVADILPRKNGSPICSGCGCQAPGYDRFSKERLFRFVPLWGIGVYFSYPMRRVDCPNCGVKVEQVPWAYGKSPRTKALELFLAQWARRLSWKEVAECFSVSWNTVFESVKAIVEYGLQHRSLEGITAIGVDEIACGKGHDYLTVVYQINEGMRRLLYVASERKEQSLKGFFEQLGESYCLQIKYICSDMWKPYLKVIKEQIPHALHILDRFHIVANLNKALDQVRAEEAKRLYAQGYDKVLTHTKYCFLKRKENLSDKQKGKLQDVLQYDLKSVRAYLLKESFQLLWTYSSPYWANWFLHKWCARANRSKLEPIKKFVKSIRKHQHLILNWFYAKKQFSSGCIEGLNRKVNLVTRKSYGFRSSEIRKIALFHTLGALPEPKFTHRF